MPTLACGTKFGAIVGGATPPLGGVAPPSPTIALTTVTAPPLDGLTPKLGGAIMLAGVGGGGPDGAPRPATATDGADPLAVTGIGPFGPPEALGGAPRGEYVRDSSESLDATARVALLLLRTGGGVRDEACSPVFRDGSDMAGGYESC